MIYGTGRQFIVPDELWMSRCLKRFLTLQRGTVLDVGVNVGLYLVKLRALDSSRPYIGIEPNPFCNFYIQELIRLNCFTNARVLPVALSTETRAGRLLASSRDDSGASILEDVKSGQDVSFSVDTLFYRGDDLMTTLNPENGVGIIKIDVEGAESDVIDGLRNTIATNQPLIYCEIAAAFMNTSPTRRRAVEKLWSTLRDLRYRVLGVLWDASLQEIGSFTELGEPFNGEYILAHADVVPEPMRAFEAERGKPISRRKPSVIHPLPVS
jgi:FkbM family methyltransferase